MSFSNSLRRLRISASTDWVWVVVVVVVGGNHHRRVDDVLHPTEQAVGLGTKLRLLAIDRTPVRPDGAQADRRRLDREGGAGFAQRLEGGALAASEVVEVAAMGRDALRKDRVEALRTGGVFRKQLRQFGACEARVPALLEQARFGGIGRGVGGGEIAPLAAPPARLAHAEPGQQHEQVPQRVAGLCFVGPVGEAERREMRVVPGERITAAVAGIRRRHHGGRAVSLLPLGVDVAEGDGHALDVSRRRGAAAAPRIAREIGSGRKLRDLVDRVRGDHRAQRRRRLAGEQRGPGLVADFAVDVQAVGRLVGAHGGVGLRAELAIDRDAEQMLQLAHHRSDVIKLHFRTDRRAGRRLHRAGRRRPADADALAAAEIRDHDLMVLVAAETAPGAVAVVVVEQRDVMIAVAEIEHQHVAGLRIGHRRAPVEPGLRPQEALGVEAARIDGTDAGLGDAIADRAAAPGEVADVRLAGAVIGHLRERRADEVQPSVDGRAFAVRRPPLGTLDRLHGLERSGRRHRRTPPLLQTRRAETPARC